MGGQRTVRCTGSVGAHGGAGFGSLFQWSTGTDGTSSDRTGRMHSYRRDRGPGQEKTKARFPRSGSVRRTCSGTPHRMDEARSRLQTARRARRKGGGTCHCAERRKILLRFGDFAKDRDDYVSPCDRERIVFMCFSFQWVKASIGFPPNATIPMDRVSLESTSRKIDRACFAPPDCVESRFFLPRNLTILTETECPDALLRKLLLWADMCRPA